MTTSKILKIHILFLVLLQLLLTGLLFRPDSNLTAFRVAYLPGEIIIARLSPYGPGFDNELVRLFCTRHKFTPVWQPVHTVQQGIDALQNNRADIFICSSARSLLSSHPDLQTGPIYRTDQPVIVHNKWKQGLLNPQDICQDELLISRGTEILKSVQTLTRTMGCMDTTVTPTGPGLDTLLTDMTENRTRFAVVSASGFNLWQPFFPDIRPSLNLHQTFGTAWSWRIERKALAASLRTFWKTVPSSPFLRDLKARYLGFLPSQTDFYELDHLLEVIDTELPLYSATIRKAAQKYGFDPLLLVAMIYQESHFDPHARSKTGVRGLLQISQTTAQELGIANRLAPKASIMGGAEYLRGLADRLASQELTTWNNLFLALAAYNQGMGHLRDALTLTEKKGRDATTWRDVKKIFPLLSYKKYYSDSTYGYCRGLEAVDYVESIRYYYYFLTGLVRLARPEGKNLARLTSGTMLSRR
ncbi:MAG: transglycosylase SLT domain-containing protein [Desulfoplanes sp.]